MSDVIASAETPSSRAAQRRGDPGPVMRIAPDWIAAPLRGSQ